MRDHFQACEVCGCSEWETQYRGRVRDGAFGTLSKDECVVGRCSRCGVERLNESGCKEESFYENGVYRDLVPILGSEAELKAERDASQVQDLNIRLPDSIKNKVIAEIGCAGGAFLAHVKNFAAEILSIEPSRVYHKPLEEKGYHVYPFARDAILDWAGKVDFAFCFSVIEHVENPRVFLEEIRGLLAYQGELILSTPNRRDILMVLKGDEYRRFFYRTVHRWYFDSDAFAYCADVAGLKIVESHCAHRFGLSNALAWLRDGRPTGSATLPHLDSPDLDNYWRAYLEARGVGDYLYFKLGNQARQEYR